MPLEREAILAFRRTGKYPCPSCQSQRKKHKHDTPLSVTVNTDGIVYYCHHCNINGGIYYEADKLKSHSIRKQTGNKPKDPHRFKMRKWKEPIW